MRGARVDSGVDGGRVAHQVPVEAGAVDEQRIDEMLVARNAIAYVCCCGRRTIEQSELVERVIDVVVDDREHAP